MNPINEWMQADIVNAIGWTLLHSLWQGLLISLVLAGLLLFLKKKRPEVRYAVALGALSLLTLLVAFTFLSEFNESSALTASSLNSPLMAADKFDTAEIQKREPPIYFSGKEEAKQEPNFAWSMFNAEAGFPLLILCWIIGVLFLSLKLMGEFLFLHFLKSTSSPLPNGPWKTSFLLFKKKLKISSSIQLLQSRRINTPMVIGFFKPLILMPIGLINQLSPEEMENVLAHELAHIKRNDYLVNLLQSLLETVLFFNPAVWWISSVIRREREFCCDDQAIQLTGDNLNFIKTLARLEEWRIKEMKVAVAFSGKKGNVLARVRRISQRPFTHSGQQVPLRLIWGLLLIGLTGSLFALQVPEEKKIPLSETIPIEEVEAEDQKAVVLAETKESLEMPQRKQDEEHSPIAESSSTEKTEAVLPILSSITPDSLPDEEEKVRMEMEAMKRAFKMQRFEVEKERIELEKLRVQFEKERNALRGKMEEKELTSRKAELELRRKRENMEKDFRINRGEQEIAILQLEKEMRDLEIKQLQAERAAGEDSPEAGQLQKQIEEMEERMKQKESEMDEVRLEMEKQLIELRQQIQKLENGEWEQEKQLKDQEITLEQKGMDIEAKARQIEEKINAMHHDFRLQMAEMEIKLQQARQNKLEEDK
jgi:bla regulator protein BlaR1